ncbi:hypothetical protein FOZ63_014516, partial [Perkinsus olseni]
LHHHGIISAHHHPSSSVSSLRHQKRLGHDSGLHRLWRPRPRRHHPRVVYFPPLTDFHQIALSTLPYLQTSTKMFASPLHLAQPHADRGGQFGEVLEYSSIDKWSCLLPVLGLLRANRHFL